MPASLPQIRAAFLLTAAVTLVTSWFFGIQLFIPKWAQHAGEPFVERLYHTVVEGYSQFFKEGTTDLQPLALVMTKFATMGSIAWLYREGRVWGTMQESVFIFLLYFFVAEGVGHPLLLALQAARYFDPAVAAQRKGSWLWMVGYYCYGVANGLAFIYAAYTQLDRLHWDVAALLDEFFAFNLTWKFLVFDLAGALVSFALYSVFVQGKGVGFFLSALAFNAATGGAGFMFQVAAVEGAAIRSSSSSSKKQS